MCGFAGVIDYSTKTAGYYDLTGAADAIKSRGPDSRGFWESKTAKFVHNRLSIMDLSTAGSQPMKSNCGNYIIVFNGEIYNFREIKEKLDTNIDWASHSDTEVALYAYIKYGSACLEMFRGMFSFAIWDEKRKTLFLARDRLGVKPLYYFHDNDVLAFGSRPSTILSILNHKDFSLDWDNILLYLQSGYFPGFRSVYAGIKKLKPGHYMILNEKGHSTQPYWQYNDKRFALNHDFAKSEAELLTDLDQLITESVKLRMISDAPIGAFLSGGIDSSLVVAKMAQLNGSKDKVKAFTIGFDSSAYDESHDAKKIAQHLGIEHFTEILKTDDLLDLIPTFFQNYDEPFFDSSSFPSMAVSRLAKSHVKVSLSGDGGDEVFGGYHYYNILKKLSYLFHLPPQIRKMFSISFMKINNHKAKLISHALMQENPIDIFSFSRSINKDFSSIFTPTSRSKNSFRQLVSDFSEENFDKSLIDRAMLFDLNYTLPDDYLQKLDLASMSFSLEAREPLLDDKLVEWGINLPSKWKMRHGQNKYLLRQLAYQHVPKDILNRPKRGFCVPIAQWLRGPLKEWASERLYDTQIFQDIPILNQNNVQKVFESHLQGKRDSHPILWAILMLCEFMNSKRNNDTHQVLYENIN